MIERDTHGQLLQLVYDYVKLNLLLESKPSLNKTIELRKILSDIRRVATKRRAEVMEIQKNRRAEIDEKKGKSKPSKADEQDS